MQQLEQTERTDFAMESLRETTLKLFDYCRANNWAGHDPYDALNSNLFRVFPFLDARVPRLALTQVLKRSPINVRSLLLVDKTQNPKGLALFLIALLKLSRLGIVSDINLPKELVSRLLDLRSPNSQFYCWGYSFPWQTRTILIPRYAPNLVCTVFVANALLDAFETTGNAQSLEVAISAADYLLSDLYYTEGDDIASFSYPSPASKSKIHNANLLAAALLSRIHHHTGESRFVPPALNVARYSTAKQKADGSWVYGELPGQNWIDNFHTGYNLTALHALGQYLHTTEFESSLHRGFTFYRQHFFQENGVVRYFHNRTYPIDIHCVAQSILSLLEFRELDLTNLSLVRLVYAWAIKHMWDERGFFYYRVLRHATIRTSYMRWSQAWMFLALTRILEVLGSAEISARASAHQLVEQQ